MDKLDALEKMANRLSQINAVGAFAGGAQAHARSPYPTEAFDDWTIFHLARVTHEALTRRAGPPEMVRVFRIPDFRRHVHRMDRVVYFLSIVAVTDRRTISFNCDVVFEGQFANFLALEVPNMRSSRARAQLTAFGPVGAGYGFD